MGTGGPFPGGKTRPGRDADHSPHLVPRLRMSRSIPPLPQAPSWRVAGQLCHPQISIFNPSLFPFSLTDDTGNINLPDSNYFQHFFNDVFVSQNKWFEANKLTLNFDETNLIKFTTNNKTRINSDIGCNDKTIEQVLTTKLLGLQIDNNLNLKKHTEYIIPKLRSICFAMRTVTPLLKTDTLKLIYFAYFYSIMSYGVIFWGNSTDSKEYLT
jgi:hypothetical protein